jgi:hypothetical protein
MEEKNNNGLDKNNIPIGNDSIPKDKIRYTTMQKLKFILMIAIILALGFLIINQATGFIFKSQLLGGNACKVCVEFNPNLSSCINQRTPLYWSGNNWTIDGSNKISVNLTK